MPIVPLGAEYGALRRRLAQEYPVWYLVKGFFMAAAAGALTMVVIFSPVVGETLVPWHVLVSSVAFGMASAVSRWMVDRKALR